MIKEFLKNLFLHHKEPNITELDIAANEVVKELESLDADGEYKRHIAYGRLIKQFPTSSRSNISMAIEIAVNKLRI